MSDLTVNDVVRPRCDVCDGEMTTSDEINRRIDTGFGTCDRCIDDVEDECMCSYGYFLGGDPRQFVPDEEMDTPEEIARWADLCAAWERGEYRQPAPEEHGPWVAPDETVTLGERPPGAAVGVCRAPRSLGIGTTYCQQHALPADVWKRAAPSAGGEDGR